MRYAVPQAGSVTERKKLAQDIRNELQAYRHTADAFGNGQDRLYRTEKLLARMFELENLQATLR